jgi:UDP-N-acetylglucosamine--N-acetylmuramyl-(pentapeptide) pyrophosphoryl-undecaprenol N-acetylglucosamine transferase
VTGGAAIAFTGGGSGGHIYPGLAVIESLRRDFGGRIVWIGGTKESDRRAVEAAGVEYVAIPSGKLRRQLSLENVADAFRVLAGYATSKRVLASLRPALLFSKGGYVSVPPCRAAASLGIPVFTHESDLTPGLATRLNARRAERVLVAYEETRAAFPEGLRDRVIVTGNPLRAAMLAGDAGRGRRLLGVPEDLPVLLVLGGSQGARQVNGLVAAALPALTRRAFVAHQTGEAGAFMALPDASEALPTASEAQTSESPAGITAIPAHAGANPSIGAGRYRTWTFIHDELPDLMAAATIVVTRAGAGALWEGAALGKPLILVPLAGTATRGDQVDNARYFEARGAAKVLLGDGATPETLVSAVEAWLDDPGAAVTAGAAAKAIARSDAAGTIARLILERTGASR